MPDNVLIASDITVELGSAYVGSAYSPRASVTQTDTGWELTITYADPDTPGELATLTIPVDSAGFGEVTASVESGHGTPQVVVTESGPDTAKSFHFAFSGIGGFSPTITVTEIEGGHRVTVLDVDGTESFDVLDGDPSQAIEDAERAAALANAAASTADASAAAADTATAAAQTATTEAQGATTAAQAATGAANTAATTATNAASAAQTATTAAQAATADAESAAARADTAADAAMAMVRNVPTGTLTEGLVLTATDAAPAPLLGATVYGTSTQDGTPTPSAPVAIESVTSAALRLSGQSIWGGSAMHDDVHAAISAAVDGTNEHGDYVSFSATQASGKRLFEGAFKPDAQYTFILSVGKSNTSGNTNLRIYYTDGTYTTIARTSTDSDGTPETVVQVSTGGKTVEVLRGVNSSGTTYLYYDQCAVLEGVHTADDFQPYIGTTTPIDLDGHELRSLPDGTRDELVIASDGSVTLVQRVERYEVSTTDGNWSLSDSGTLTHPRETIPRYKGWTASKRCNAEAGGDVSTGNNAVVLRNQNSVTVEQFVTAMDGAPLVILMALDTPVVHTLPSVTMPTAPSPEMNAWATSSPSTTLTITYERDINMALVATRDEAMAAIADSDGPTATATHAVGTYLTMGGKLYRVTTSIAIGESIIPGSNVVATTVMAEVLALVQ